MRSHARDETRDPRRNLLCKHRFHLWGTTVVVIVRIPAGSQQR